MRGDILRAFKAVAAGLLLAAVLLPSLTRESLANGANAPDTSIQSQFAAAYQINATHSGSIAFTTALTTPLQQLWSVNLGGSVSYPLVADGFVFVVVNGNELFALNLATGATVWEKLLSGSWNAIAYDNTRIFDIDQGGQLLAVKAATGQPVWDVQLPDQYYFSAPPTAEGSMVFVGGAGDGGTLYGSCPERWCRSA